MSLFQVCPLREVPLVKLGRPQHLTTEGRYIVCGLCLCVLYSLLSTLHLFTFILLFLIRVSIHIVSLLPFLPLLSLSSPSSPSFPLTTPKVNFNEPLSTSCYAANRVNKPFNPMLGETYECDRRAELGWRCFMEQVRGCDV